MKRHTLVSYLEDDKKRTSFSTSFIRFWHLVETSIEDSVLAPLSKEWISNVNRMVAPHLLNLKDAYNNFWRVRDTFCFVFFIRHIKTFCQNMLSLWFNCKLMHSDPSGLSWVIKGIMLLK